MVTKKQWIESRLLWLFEDNNTSKDDCKFGIVIFFGTHCIKSASWYIYLIKLNKCQNISTPSMVLKLTNRRLPQESIKYNCIFINKWIHLCTGCPKKHGNSVTNWISSLLWISNVIPNFESHNIIMSARAYFMKRVKDV